MSTTDFDLSALPDGDLRARYRALSDEISRRHELETGPQRVREISERHCEIGGNPQDLVDQIRTVAHDVDAAQDGGEVDDDRA